MKLLFRALWLCLLGVGIIACGAPGEHSTQSLLTSNQDLQAAKTGRYLVPVGSQDLSDRIAAEFDAEGIKDGALIVYATPDQAKRLRALAPRSWMDVEDIQAELTTQMEALPEDATELYNFEKVQKRIQTVAKENADIAELINYGTSTGGRSLSALRITAPGNSDGRTAVMITGATHGNEILTVDVVMALIDESVSGYAISERFKAMLGSRVIYFVPVVSPDSYVTNSRNVDGVDPNREYPWPEKISRNPTRVISAIMDFSASLNIAGSIDYHSTASMIMYPWAWTRSIPADNQKYEDVAKSMAAVNRYQTGQISRILYVAQGSSADYYYWKYGSISFGVELSQGSPSAVNQVIQENRESTWRFVEAMN